MRCTFFKFLRAPSVIVRLPILFVFQFHNHRLPSAHLSFSDTPSTNLLPVPRQKPTRVLSRSLLYVHAVGPLAMLISYPSFLQSYKTINSDSPYLQRWCFYFQVARSIFSGLYALSNRSLTILRALFYKFLVLSRTFSLSRESTCSETCDRARALYSPPRGTRRG